MIDYPAHLNKMWQLAIAERESDAPMVVSTFAGGGGSLTGYMMAGYNDLLAIEWDDNAVDTLRINWPNLDIYHGDIAKISVEDVLERTGLKSGELDLLDGSPPCQGFSTAGKRDLDDDRNQLFREYVRLLRGLWPKVFVMENVSGLVKGKMKLVFAEIMRELKASGYKVSCRLLNAMYFHVPQSRQRLIFIGVRDDLGIEPSHPRAESVPIVINKVLPIFRLDYDTKGQFSRFGISVSKEPLPTITKGNRYHFLADFGQGKRKFQIDEAKLFSSFPTSMKIAGKDNDAWKRIGNSVPPLMAEAVGRHIKNKILAKIRPEFVI